MYNVERPLVTYKDKMKDDMKHIGIQLSKFDEYTAEMQRKNMQVAFGATHGWNT